MKKDLSLINDQYRELRNGIIEGQYKIGYQGQVSEEKVIFAEQFLKKFPIGSIIKNGDFEDFLEENGLYPQPLPKNQEYHKLVRTVYRQVGIKHINSGVLNDQWRNPKDAFQIRIYSHGDELEVVSLARSAIDSAVSIEEKPKSIKTHRAKITKKLIEGVDFSALSTNEKGELIEALGKTKQALIEYKEQKLISDKQDRV